MVNKRFQANVGLYWTLVGIFATIMLGVPALYFTLQERTPSLRFEITSESNVLDLHTSLEDLDIIFQGENIRKTNQNLRIITFTISNNGQTTILQNQYDVTEPFGLELKDAQLVDAPRVVDSNSDYLLEKFLPTFIDSNMVEFQKVIFDRGKYISFELLLLHEKSATPLLEPIGKVAGINRLIVTRKQLGHETSTFWGTVLEGSIWIQLARFGLFLIFIIFIVILLIGWENFSSYRRQRKVISLQNKQMQLIEEHFQPLFNNLTPIDKKFTVRLLYGTDGSIEVLSEILEIISTDVTVNEMNQTKQFHTRLSTKRISRFYKIQEKIPDAIFEYKENGYVISSRASRVINKLVDFLRANSLPEEFYQFPPLGRIANGFYYPFSTKLIKTRKPEKDIDWDKVHYEMNDFANDNIAVSLDPTIFH
jgi:hypothetical protein